MVDLSEKRHDAGFVHSANASVRNLNKAQICDILALMGQALSDRKMNRKIAVVAGIVNDYEVGQFFYAQELCDIINRQYLRNHSEVSPNSVANILNLCAQWGLIEVQIIPIRRHAEGRNPGTRYRRLK
jgi:hypothetical protein|tara:strand:- start:871 stop:1254 length:384 start_codon:yes stop_codon:yes gene_type:complete